VPVGYGGRVHEPERGVCLYWVNVGGLGDESVKLNFKYGFLQTENYILTDTEKLHFRTVKLTLKISGSR
jgi:hypothetical protein